MKAAAPTRDNKFEVPDIWLTPRPIYYTSIVLFQKKIIKDLNQL